MSRGPRSAPPELPGFTPDRWIGGGGFADVFLYTQLRPSRSVAVKILRREHLSAQALANFDAEADIMAEVSTHPYIVTIFASGVSPDGRPYIVMEHYPQPNFGERARGGALDLTEVLRTGIQVASAVETAHRAGIVHRDIKPANILTSTFGRPGLTDFGISGVQTEGVVTEAIGITVAYTAPEILNEESTGSISTDVYGLGATVSALAAGHSPFWSPSGDNGDQAVLARALSGQVAPVSRPDVPNSLNHLLAQTMDPNPAHRPSSALALAQSLQQIEQELRLQPTPIEVAPSEHDARHTKDKSTDPDDGERTRRSIQVVNPHGPADTSGSPTPVPGAAPGTPDVPIIAASTAAPPPVSTASFAPPAATPGPPPATSRAPTTGPGARPGAPTPDNPISAVPGASASGKAGGSVEDDPTVARARPGTSSSPGAPASPVGPRVPSVTTTPSWERGAPGHDEESDTVARPRAHRPFAPPKVIGPPITAPGAPVTPATPVGSGATSFRPTDGAAGPGGMATAPDPDSGSTDPSDRAPRPARKPLPWKPLGAAAALLVAVVAVVMIASMGGRDAKNAPGDVAAPSGGPIQSIEAGDDPGVPAKTPTDLALTPFTAGAAGTSSATITWTPPTDKAVKLLFQIVPMNSTPSNGTSITIPAGDTTGKLVVTLLEKDGACTGVKVGDTALPDRYCTAGPPCFQVTAQKTGASDGNQTMLQITPDGGDGSATVGSTAITPATYDQACADVFSGGN